MLKKKGLNVLLVATMAGATLLAGCSSSDKEATSTNTKTESTDAKAGATAAQDKVIQHVWGETTIKGTPKKVIALDFYVVDTLASLGVSPAGIAGTGKTRVPAYMQDKVSKEFTDVGERKEPNLEVIRSVSPDLIVANPERAKMIKNELENIGTTIALSDKSYQDILKNVELMGIILDKKDEAKKVQEDLLNKVKKAKEKIKGEPTVLVIGAFEDEFTVWVKDSFIGTLLSDAGVKYAYEGAKEASEGKADIAKITLERLAEINPDYLFVYGSSVQKLKDNPLFKNLKAVKENHMMEVEQDLWSRGRGPIAAGLILDQGLPLLTGEKK
jgi:ABC-type Fe3+-citrate transport system substrate-binding protein